jgi:hypothetical protein
VAGTVTTGPPDELLVEELLVDELVEDVLLEVELDELLLLLEEELLLEEDELELSEVTNKPSPPQAVKAATAKDKVKLRSGFAAILGNLLDNMKITPHRIVNRFAFAWDKVGEYFTGCPADSF